MKADAFATRLRTKRKTSGLTQKEISDLLGTGSRGTVSKHERSQAISSLEAAIGYEILFREPIATLFAELYQSMAFGVESRIAQMEQKLGTATAKGPHAAATAKKLVFFNGRSNSEHQSSIE